MRRKEKKRGGRSQPALLVCMAVFLLALAFTVYPVISSQVAEKYRSTALTEYHAQMQNLDGTSLQESLALAEAYNRALRARRRNPGEEAMLLNKPAEGYEQVLNLQGTGLMGFIRIPALDIELPVYHGLEGKTLEEGIGHMPGSSLPVGGAGTHAVLAGHSALAAQPLFSDLDKLQKGDHFTLEILHENLEYEVDEIRVVLPEDVSGLQPQEGEDLVTLVTCTPYGVNTHRLLVRGKRTAAVPEREHPVTLRASEKPASTWKSQYESGLQAGLLLILTLLVLPVLVCNLWRETHPKRRSKHGK